MVWLSPSFKTENIRVKRHVEQTKILPLEPMASPRAQSLRKHSRAAEAFLQRRARYLTSICSKHVLPTMTL